MVIGGDGMYYFKTEMPGNESENGWGPDPMAHIHYDILCKGCAESSAFKGDSYEWYCKFYPEGVCTEKACGAAGPPHKAVKVGTGMYHYDMVMPESMSKE
jgi:hypothetical protein